MRRRFVLTALMVLLPPALSGCQQQEGSPETVEQKAEAYLAAGGSGEGIAITSSEEILGEWRVATISGKELGQSYPIAVAISNAQIMAKSQCISFRFRYTISVSGFAAKLWTYRPGSNPPPQCERALGTDEAAFRDALLSADSLRQLADGALVLSGPQSSVTMFTYNNEPPDPTPLD